MKGNAEGEERGAGAGVGFGRAFGEIHQGHTFLCRADSI